LPSRKRNYAVVTAGLTVASASIAYTVALSKKVKKVHTEIEINASDECVWKVLTDFPNFNKWNPFITKISGTLTEGSRLKVRIQPFDEKPMNFRPIILKIRPNRELRWIGKFAIPGLFTGEHAFSIEPLGNNHVRFIHTENFTGLFMLLYGNNFDVNIRQRFEEMNRALKAKAEQISYSLGR
jgi:hypothetical protein